MGPGAAVPARGQCMLDKDADGDLDCMTSSGSRAVGTRLPHVRLVEFPRASRCAAMTTSMATNYGCYADAAPYNFSPLLTDGTVVCAEGGHYADTVNPGVLWSGRRLGTSSP